MTNLSGFHESQLPLRGPALWECFRAAVAAPSIHNTQPWRFRLHTDCVEVYLDRSRQLSVLDATGREALISVGAALFNLRVAILAHGRVPRTCVLAGDSHTDLVARVYFEHAVRPSPTARRLAEAIPLRHTNRHPFAETSVPPEVLAELVSATAAEGAYLAVADAGARETVLGLVRTAERRIRRETDYWRELAQWTRQSPQRRDGVPSRAYGPRSTLESVPLRDFGLIEPARHRPVATFESEPTIAVLYSRGDSPPDWVRAGQALERTLLTATVRGVATTLMTQPLEIPELRSLLCHTAVGLVPQAIMRCGYGPPSLGTLRRPIKDFVEHNPGEFHKSPAGRRVVHDNHGHGRHHDS